MPLNEYLENNKIDKIDVLKIDTEGYEFEILQGLKNQIKVVDIIFFEHHYDDMINKSYTYSDIHNLLKKIILKKYLNVRCLLEKPSNIFIEIKLKTKKLIYNFYD